MIFFPPHVFKSVHGRLLCPRLARAVGSAVVMCVFGLLFPVPHPQFRGLDARDCNSEYTYECQAFSRCAWICFTDKSMVRVVFFGPIVIEVSLDDSLGYMSGYLRAH